MRHIVVDGLRLEYRDLPATRPDLPPILLLHEGLGCVAMWRHFPEQLAEATGCRVVVWSRAGYGGSQAYEQPRTPRYMHREALLSLPAFADALGVSKAILVGHSDGGSIALMHAAAFPERVVGVAVMAPHEFVEEETIAGIRAAVEVWNSSDLPAKLGRYHPDPQRVFHDWCDTWLAPEFRDWNIADCLAEIACPVLAIQGEDDEYATMRQIEVIEQEIANSCLIKLPKCGHSPHKDQPAMVLEAVGAFILACVA